MVFSAEDLVVWSDFPKGLRVLLLDDDPSSAADTRLKLEAMDYFVFSYCNGTEALEAISKKAESFHIAIVEVTSANSHGIFKFLGMAKDLPTIAISDSPCLNTMIKCIALGAAEFLQKPLSEEKLRNIWQHVIHKAFNAGGSGILKSLHPIKEKVVSISNIQEPHKICLNGKDNLDNVIESTQVRKNSHSKSKSVDNTTHNSRDVAVSNKEEPILHHTEDEAEEEVTSDDGSKTDECSSIKDGSQPSSHMQNGENTETTEDRDKERPFPHSSSTSHSRIKIKKYRMHKRHILPKDDTRWLPHIDSRPRVYTQKSVMAIPLSHFNRGVPPYQVYSFWGHPSYYTPGTQSWGSTGFPTWHPSQGSWLWKTHPEIHADAWGCPVVPPYSQFPRSSQSTVASDGWNACGSGNRVVSEDSYDYNLAEEVINDDVMKEAMSKPWLPLPLGLKPPSIDSVIAELQHRGIHAIPPISRS